MHPFRNAAACLAVWINSLIRTRLQHSRKAQLVIRGCLSQQSTCFLNSFKWWKRLFGVSLKQWTKVCLRFLQGWNADVMYIPLGIPVQISSAEGTAAAWVHASARNCQTPSRSHLAAPAICKKTFAYSACRFFIQFIASFFSRDKKIAPVEW